MTIRAVFFDAGNTILRPVEPPAQIYARAFRKWGLTAGEEEVTRVFEETWNSFNREVLQGRDKFAYYPGGERVFWRDFVGRVAGALGDLEDFDSCFEELYTTFRLPSNWILYPEVMDTLNELTARSIKLGIISNWDSSLKSILDSLGITRHFEIILVSSLIGIAKPNPHIFELASRALGEQPGRCLHVGDSPLDDFHGARSAGFRGLLLDPHNRHNGTYPSIRNIREVLQWLS